jgi:hypothetical protein
MPTRRRRLRNCPSKEKSNPDELLAHISAARHQQHTGKAWFQLFRIYGPLEPWFDHTWRLNEFEPLD